MFTIFKVRKCEEFLRGKIDFWVYRIEIVIGIYINLRNIGWVFFLKNVLEKKVLVN